MKAIQKYHHGDLVQISTNLGPMMSHFENNKRAIVIGSYKDQFGGSNIKDYTIWIEGSGECSWYPERTLNLIERNRDDLLREWQKAEDRQDEIESSLDWIFAERRLSLSGCSIQALADCLKLGNLWGSNGEGVTHYHNSLQIMMVCKTFLENADKEGFLAFAKRFNEASLGEPVEVANGMVVTRGGKS